jgi:hypothetical protein
LARKSVFIENLEDNLKRRKQIQKQRKLGMSFKELLELLLKMHGVI